MVMIHCHDEDYDYDDDDKYDCFTKLSIFSTIMMMVMNMMVTMVPQQIPTMTISHYGGTWWDFIEHNTQDDRGIHSFLG